MTKEKINHYLKQVTKEEYNFGRAIEFTTLDGKLKIFVYKCVHDLKDKHDLMNLWKKAGRVDEFLPTHIDISTSYNDNGNCYGAYNIMHKKNVLNFDYMREWNENNINELVAECLRLYFEDTLTI